MQRMLNDRLGAPPPSLTPSIQPDETKSGGSSNHGEHARVNPPTPDSKKTKGCSFRAFLACKPKEYSGSYDPKVTMRWITEMEQIIRASECSEEQKVTYASLLLKDDALAWWNSLYATLDKKEMESWSWDDFVKRIKAKFCPNRDVEKMVEEIFALRKDNLTVDEYTKKFTDMIPFVNKSLPTERTRINHYANGLPADYETEVKRAATLDDAIIAARSMEDTLKRKAKEGQSVGEKRKFEGSSGSNFNRNKSQGYSKKAKSWHGKESRSVGKNSKHNDADEKKGDISSAEGR